MNKKDIKIGRKFKLRYLGKGDKSYSYKEVHSDNDKIFTITDIAICNAKVIVVSDFRLDGVAAAFPAEIFLSDDFNCTPLGLLADIIE